MTLAQKDIKRMIVGLGVSGLATARFCQRMGWNFDLCDSREGLANADAIRQQFPDARLTLGPLDGELFCNYHQLIVSPGVALAEPAIQHALGNQVEVVGDVELFARGILAPVVAITGSNGKSTVTTLVRDMLVDAGLRAEMGGNIGVPVLDLLEDGAADEADVFVLELSSFQLETTTSLKPRAATILNISEDHMDRYKGLADYCLAKQRVYRGAHVAVVNRDDDLTLPEDEISAETGFTLGEPQGDDFGLQAGELNGVAGEWIVRAGLKLIHSSEMKVRGRHNLANAMAALALVETLGVSPAKACQTLKSFGGLEHRCQWVGDAEGISYFNDSKGTNVGATLAAIDGLAQTPANIWLLAGGEGKGQDFSPLQDACSAAVKGVACFGKDAPRLQQTLADVAKTASFETMDQAFAWAQQHAECGDIVLLSPACASLDQFRNYHVRGEHFCSLVGEVLNGG